VRFIHKHKENIWADMGRRIWPWRIVCRMQMLKTSIMDFSVI